MDKLFCVYSSDSLTLDGSIIPASTLASALDRIWDTGVPSCIGHDLHRPFGWSRPMGIYFEPGLTRLYGMTYIANTETESMWIHNEVLNSIAARIERECVPYLPELKNKIARYLNGNEELLECSGTALVRKNLAVDVFPDIFALRDDDGLIPLRNLNYLGDGVFKVGELLLYAHPYYRRSLSRLNNANDELIRSLLHTQKFVDVKIALDSDMVGLASTFIPKIEHEYWWGPKFDDNLTSIQPGVTRHIADDREKLFHAINWTDFFWYSRDGLHTFETEEIRDIPSFGAGNGMYGCRYVHSIIDEYSGEVLHFDGAVKEYTEEQMIMRLDIDISKSERDAMYTKLWRLDGHIPVSLWKEIITHHFRDNHLVGEYLGGFETNPRVAVDQVLEPVAVEDKDGELDLIPKVPQLGTGPRLAVSFHAAVETKASRIIIPLETWNTENSSVEIVESTTVEIIKSLRRHNVSLECSSGCEFYIVEDMYSNFPLIHHMEPHMMKETIQAFQDLIYVWNLSNHDRVININLSFGYQKHSVRISLLGHIRDLPPTLDFLMNHCESMVHDDFAWCSNIAEFLKRSYPESHDNPRLMDLLTKNGRLCIKREFVDYERYNFNVIENSGLSFQVELPVDETKLINAMSSGEINVCWAGWYSSTCSRCGEEYRNCACSVYLDPDTHEIVTSMEPFGFIWTDRKS